MQTETPDSVGAPGRLEALRRTGLLDSPAEEAFDRLTRLAARFLNTPVALVSLVDQDRQFFKSCVGLPEPWASERETPLSHSFCQHVVAREEPLIVEDAREHPLVRENLAIPDLGVVAYAGIPLVTSGGEVLGSFCAIDTRPRKWTEEEIRILSDLAGAVSAEIELRLTAREAADHLAGERVARQEAQAARQRMATILESITEAFFALDRDWRFTYLNAEAEHLLQRPRAELLGKSIWEEFPEAVGSTFYERYHEAVRERRAVQFEEFYPPLDTWFEVRAFPSEDGLSIYFHDITEQKRLEETIRESENRFRIMFRDSPLSMWVFDLETKAFLDVNEAAVRQYGYSREEFLSMTIQDIRPPEEVPQLEQVFAPARRGIVHRGLFHHRKKDGSIIDVEVSTQEITSGNRPARVALVMDVTERTRAEREREQLIQALEAERARLGSIFSQAPAVIALYHGPEHVINMVNPTWETMVGKHDAVGRRFRDVFPELEGSGLFELLDGVFETGEPYVGNEQLVLLDRAGDGHPEETFWNFVWQPVDGPDGRVRDVMVHAVEVTDQVRARRWVEEFAAERTAILGQIADGVIVTDAAGRIAFVNDAAQRIHGVARLDVTPEAYAETYHLFTLEGEPYPSEELPLARAVRNGETVTDALWRIRRPDGTEVVAQGSAAPVATEEGKRLGAVLTLRDVTEQRLLQRQLEVERVRLREVFLQAPALIAVLRGPEHVYELANPPYLALVGNREIVGKPIREALPELEGQGYFEMLDGVYRTGEPVVGNEMHAVLDRHGEGTLDEGYFNFVFHPLRDVDGAVGGILIHAVEVTEQVRSRHEVERKAEELARLARALEISNRELDQFAYVASHDLKAPLRGIANLSQWIEEDIGVQNLSDDTREHLGLLRGRVHRMEGLIDGILQYSRAGRVREKAEPVDTGALLREVVDLLAPPANVAVQVQPDMPTLVAERLPLQQVFMNLIGNAIKYTRRPAARVEVGAREAGEFWEFFVRDNGPGIAPEYHDRIFGIFQTLEARDKVEGTGIGLSIVKKTVDSRGGRVWVESEEGAGATFRFLWPKLTPRED
jgi:PAS domain S-box-containing protein